MLDFFSATPAVADAFGWHRFILWPLVLGNVFIALSCLAIVGVVAYANVFQPKIHPSYRPLVRPLLLFISFVAIESGFQIWNIWYGDYFVNAILKAMTGAISIYIAILLYIVVPKILALRAITLEELQEEAKENIEKIDELQSSVTSAFQAWEIAKALFEQRHFGVALTNDVGQMIEVNDRYAHILGYRDRHDLEQNFDWVNSTHPDDVAEDLKQVDRCVRGRIRSYTLDKRYKHKEGRWTPVCITVTRLEGPQFSHDETHKFLVIAENLSNNRPVERATLIYAR